MNDNDSSEEDDPMGENQPEMQELQAEMEEQMPESSSAISKHLTDVKNVLGPYQTKVSSAYFIDFTQRPNGIRFLPETNQLQIEVLKNTKPVAFNMDCRLFNDAGPLNDAIKQIMKDGGKPETLCEDPTCYFVLYGAEFKLHLIVFKLPREKISNLKPVFKRCKDKGPVFDEEHVSIWLRKKFQEFKANNKKGGGKKKNREFLERQFESKLENVDKNELDQLIGTREITDYHFGIYKNVYQQATVPTNNFYEFAQIGKDSGPCQDLDGRFSYNNFVFNGNDEEERFETDRKLLRDLWIASSHNTYVKENQIFDKSCALAYIKVLLTGCRCIELDLWPTKDNQGILVAHRMKLKKTPIVITLTAPIPFETVLKVIRVYAFEVSKYPLILSLEDHCEEDLQLKMAEMFEDYLGDLLLTEELKPEGTAPELNRLMGKILIKHSALNNKEREAFLILKNEILLDETFDVKYAQNDIWHKKRVVLYNDRVEIGESEELADVQLEEIEQKPQLTKADQLILDRTEENERRKDEQDLIREISKLDIEELPFVCKTDPATAHLSEVCYHGVLDAKEAIARLNAAKSRVPSGQSPDGIFLIRRMSQNSDEYVLSVIHQGRPKHVRIRYEPDNQGQKVFTIEHEEGTYKPNKLTDLVAYYHEHGFKIGASGQDIFLREACPRPVQTLTEQEPRPRWFFPDMSSARAHFLLQAYPEGTCLVRTDESFNQDGYILTVRLRYIIQHFRLKQDGDKFYVNSSAFNSIEEIIGYFQRHPFLDEIRLEPIQVDDMTNQTVDEMMEHYNEAIFYEGEYYEEPIKMRTVAPFIAHTLFGQQTTIPSDQLIDKIKESPTLVMFAWNFQYYFINPEQESFWADEFDPNAFQTFQLNHQSVTDSLRGEFEPMGQPERQGLELVYEETVNEAEFIYNCVRFSTESSEVQKLWIDRLKEQIEKTNRIMSIRDEDLEPSKGGPVHPRMSNLAVYLKNYKFEHIDEDDVTHYNKVCSISNYTFWRKNHKKPLNEYNAVKMSRIYPVCVRTLSGNYDPVICWNAGCQMVALNYQMDGKKMLKNYARFLANGGCGYVAKPDYLKTPITAEETAKLTPKYLTIKVISGRNLSRLFEHSSGICSPMVEFWLDESKRDQDYQKTRGNRSNGLNPVWEDQSVTFEIRYPELALIRLQVIDADYIGWINLNYDGFWKWKSPARAQFVGQAAFPVKGLQTGIKSVPLLNNFNKHLELSSLLVEITLSDKKPSKKRSNIPPERQPSKPTEKGQRLGTLPKQPEPMEIDPDQPGPSGTSF